jgi:ATP-dependent exoDNAse (exonuclease V) beta subunit
MASAPLDVAPKTDYSSPMRTADHPSGLKIEFHPEPHHYHLDGEKLDSVTSRIHKWFPQFDAGGVARKKAQREGLEAEALLAQWERKRDDAATFGSKIHLMAETIISENDDRAADGLPENERERMYLAAVKMAIARVRPAYDFVATEKIVFSPGARVAGTIDILMRSRHSGEWVVGDWKTNREIKFQGFRGEMGHGVCRELANCNFIHYSLQTAAYAELLTSESYLPSEDGVRGVLFHLKETRAGVTCDFIKTRDLRVEARAILGAPVNPNLFSL